MKLERDSACEACGLAFALEQLCVHHILETRIFPEFAREPLNMIVLCFPCHSSITNSEGFAASIVMLFYSELPPAVRQRHLPFVSAYGSPALASAFRLGDPYFWNDRAVDDLTR